MHRSTPAPQQSIDDLALLWRNTIALMHQRSAGDTLAVMNDVGLTLPQMIALFALRSFGPHSVCDIADRLRLSRAATSHLVDRLVAAQMVERQEDADDRRQKRITITTKAQTLLARLDEERTREFVAIAQSLSPELRTAFAEVLKRVKTELEAQHGPLPLRCQKATVEIAATRHPVRQGGHR